MEHKKIKFARQICRNYGVKYKIQGRDDALFILKNGHYKQVCFSLLNLSEEQIRDLVRGEISGIG